MQNNLWIGTIPPQYLFTHRQFVGVALEPPDYNPGSWIGAGKALFDAKTGQILLTARPRKAEGKVRGYRADIYGSFDGLNFTLVGGLSKEAIEGLSNIKIHSIEGTQLLCSPATGQYHLYLSVDSGEDFIWGGLHWETLLLTAPSIQGPWQSHGLILKTDQDYDANQARDISIDIIDGLWVCVYKAMDKNRKVRPALATSNDGLVWEKQGPLTIDGLDKIAFLHGSFIAGTIGPIFIGLESSIEDDRVKKENVVYYDEYGIGHGSSPTYAVAYALNMWAKDLKTLYRSYWEPGSPFEHIDYPLLGYSSMIFDNKNNRFLMYVEAIDNELTQKIGLNETVERVLVYQVDLRDFE